MPAPPIRPDGFYHPSDEDEVRDLIFKARDEGKVLRARGSAHSVLAAIFSHPEHEEEPDPNGINLMLDRMRAVEFDDANQRVTAQAGCNLGLDPVDPTESSTLENSLFFQMSERGWALSDTGGIIHQTVAGFLSTGSSGGSMIHSVEDDIVAIHLIDGLGQKHVLTEADDPDRFHAAGVSMGLLGIIVAVTFQCEPAYWVIGQESTTTEDDAPMDVFGPGTGGKPSLETFLRDTEYTRLLWWPQEDVQRIMTWQARRMTPAERADPQYAEPKPYEQFPEVLGSSHPVQFLAGTYFELIGAWNEPGLIGDIARGILGLLIEPATNAFTALDGPEGPKEFWDEWWRALPMDNEVSDEHIPTQFTEMWLPIARTEEVMRRLRDHYRTGGIRATGPYACEIYQDKASRFWMSPGFELDTVRIDLFWFANFEGDPSQTYFPQFWDLLSDLDFRLHWGKYLSADSADTMRPLYPKWDDFMQVREELDPHQLFVSPYWRDHLGIPQP